VLRGDLRTTPLPELLRSLAGAAATGCVYLLADGQQYDAEEAAITLRDGAICGVTLPSTGDALGTRLVATHQLSPADLAEARLAQETELASWVLADLLIHLGLADEDTVQRLTAEQALSNLTQICAWKTGSWRFRRRARLGRNLPIPLPVDEALTTVNMRLEQWRRLLPTILGSDAVVSLASDVPETVDPDATGDEAGDNAATAVAMDPDAFVLLCTVDGTRSMTELAVASGFTLLDAGRLTAELIGAGLVQVARDPSKPPLPGDVLESEITELEPDVLAGEPDAMAEAFTFDADNPLLPENISYGFSPTGPEWEPPSWQQSDRLADALARVSAALSEAMVEPAAAVAPTLAVEVLGSAPLEALSELVHDEAAETAETEEAEETAEAESEAILDTVQEPYDDALLETVEALTLPEPVEAAIATPDPVVEIEEIAPVEEVEPVAEVAEIEEVEKVVAEAPIVRQVGRTANAAEASRMLSALAGETFGKPFEDEADEEIAEPAAQDKHPAPAGYAPTPRRQTGPADTAALLRELSSLGAENGGGAGNGTNGTSRPTPARPAPSSAPNSGAASKGKRKGLFGRN
jgi:hypothetical protein